MSMQMPILSVQYDCVLVFSRIHTTLLLVAFLLAGFYTRQIPAANNPASSSITGAVIAGCIGAVLFLMLVASCVREQCRSRVTRLFSRANALSATPNLVPAAAKETD